jgi:hypothetical protein
MLEALYHPLVGGVEVEVLLLAQQPPSEEGLRGRVERK